MPSTLRSYFLQIFFLIYYLLSFLLGVKFLLLFLWRFLIFRKFKPIPPGCSRYHHQNLSFPPLHCTRPDACLSLNHQYSAEYRVSPLARPCPTPNPLLSRRQFCNVLIFPKHPGLPSPASGLSGIPNNLQCSSHGASGELTFPKALQLQSPCSSWNLINIHLSSSRLFSLFYV